MRILVTGGNGFIGSYLVEALNKWKPNSVILAPTSKELDLKVKIPNLGKFDYIFHLAAYTQAGDFCDRYPFHQHIINNHMNLNMLEYWTKYSPNAKFIGFGTSVSYGTVKELNEGEYLKGIPVEMYESYAYSKRSLLVGLQAARKQLGLNFLYYIPSTVVGKNYPIDGRNLHFIYDIARKFVQYKIGISSEVKLFGSPTTTREVINANDLCKLILNTLPLSNEVFNIGSKRFFSMEMLANSFCDILKLPNDIYEFDQEKGFGSKSKFLNSEKIWQHSYFSETAFNDTLKEIIEWAYLYSNEKDNFG